VVASKCKFHNDGSISLSRDGQLLACFAENIVTDNPVWADTLVQVISLRSFDKGMVLYQKTFGPFSFIFYSESVPITV